MYEEVRNIKVNFQLQTQVVCVLADRSRRLVSFCHSISIIF
jgi:hypothetical protein